MRKWMRERLKRRKKADPKAEGAEPGKAPLQPAYFDAAEGGDNRDTVTAAAEETAGEIDSSGSPEPEQGSSDSGSSQASVPSAGGDSAQKKRRRRGRGGRGRGRGREPRPAAAEGAASSAAASEIPSQATSIPQVAPASASSRPSKGVVVLAIGLPGSGKSSWFKRHSITPLSSDMLRALLFDDAQEQRFQDLVFSNLRSMLKARLIARRPTNYVDATNLTPQERQNWVKLAHDYGYEAQAVYFDVPLDVCMERNQKRNRAVEEEAMRRMSGKLRPPTFEEGFTKITVVRVKKKENEAAS